MCSILHWWLTMTEADKARRLKASANYRHKRDREGEAQVNFWLPGNVREWLDQEIRAGRFKNRSEAAKAAFNRLREANMN